MRVLIVGAGIAGLTAALELRGGGHEVTVIERLPEIPPGGYMLDFYGPGYDVAERLSLLSTLEGIRHPINRIVLVDGRGHVTTDVSYPRLRRGLFRDRHLNLMRGELARALRDRLDREVMIRFGTWPTALDPEGDRITVRTNEGAASYDLVVGADGAHSRIRDLAFLAGETSIVRLGCHTAAYIAEDAAPELLTDAFVQMSAPGLSAAAYPIRDGRTATFFLHDAKGALAERGREACRRELDATYRGHGWILDKLLDAFPAEGSVFFDDVFQVDVAHWSGGRVVLVGDAAWCVSLLAGQGASLAMYGAYVLAQEISRSPADLTPALERYEARVRPLVTKAQHAGRRARSWFLPKTQWGRRVRDQLTDLVVKTPAARLLGRFLGGSHAQLD